MDRVIIIDKPAGITSARVVEAVKRLLPRMHRNTKVGHSGTLDCFATGVLVILIGRATRQAEQIMSMHKTYEATIKFGAITATDDPDSPEQPFSRGEPAPPPPARSQIEQALRQFVGTIKQRPPVYSAVKIQGHRASDRARRGVRVVVHPRVIQIHAVNMLHYEWPFLNVRIECGRGTYIRSIARDLGANLSVGGYLYSLRRTRIGPYTIEQAVPLSDLVLQGIQQHGKAIEDPQAMGEAESHASSDSGHQDRNSL